MNTPRLSVICDSGMPMALAFSRSIVTSSLRVVGGERREQVRSNPCASRLAPTIWWATPVEITKRVAPLVLQHELEAAEAPTPLTAGGWNTATIAPSGHHQHRSFGAQVAPQCPRPSVPCPAVHPIGLVARKIMPAIGRRRRRS